MSTPTACPCGGFGTRTQWAECCGRFVADGQIPQTCEELMRSRYSAFAVGDENHLWRTWHPRTRPPQVGDLGGVRWVRLDVLATDAGGEQDDTGTVDFAAHFITDDGERGAVREHSRFSKRVGRWFYVDGNELA